MRIILDAMGGDNAPGAIVKGALLAAAEFTDCTIVLVGQEEKLRAELGGAGLPQRVEIVNATQVIEMEDDPANAFRAKKDSSMTVGLNLLKRGDGDAFISAGSTGALLSAATLLVKRVKGIRRAAVAPIVPTGCAGGTLLIDAGTNAECQPEYLLQFAFMGAFYAQRVMGCENPRVGLLNIGSEPGKGDALRKETYGLLTAAKEAGKLNFVGNVEAREAVMGQVDVLVADGFSGNVFLKAVEGTAIYLMGMLKDVFKKNLASKVGYLLVKDGMGPLKKKLDYREVGGSALLGITKPVIKAHGSSDERAIFNAIRQARTEVQAGVVAAIAENVEFMTIKQEG